MELKTFQEATALTLETKNGRVLCTRHRRWGRDGACYECAVAWINEHGDDASRWALKQLDEYAEQYAEDTSWLESQAYDHGHGAGFKEGLQAAEHPW